MAPDESEEKSIETQKPVDLLIPRPPALIAARLKVVRAQEHLYSLQAEEVMFWEQHINSATIKDDGEFLTITPKVGVSPSARFSTIIGDVVTNARASLDHLFFGIVGKFFDPPFDVTDREDRRISGFPIWSPDYDKGYADKLIRLAKRKIPTPILDEVESVQPRHAGYEPIGRLNYLVNTDKHRALLVTLGFVDTAKIVMMVGNIRSVVSGKQASNGIRLHAGPGIRAAIKDGNMKVDAQGAIHITWQDSAMPSEPVEVTLSQILNCVVKINDSLGRFLGI